jgi:hypothetical protein
MNLQEKLERMARTSFERRLLRHWLAAKATRANDEESREESPAVEPAEGELPPATGTDGP